MPIHYRFRTCLAASALLFSALFANAQTTPAPTPKTAPTAAQPTTAREASTGMATGRRQQQVAKPATTTPADPAAADAKKNIGNVKWEDRQAATNPPALDATAKDAAKAPTTLDGASKDAAKSKTTPPASPSEKKHQNSIESISVQH